MNLLDIHGARQAFVEGEHVASKCDLQIGVFEELIDRDVGNLTPLKFDHDPHPIFIRLVADIGNAGNRLFIDEVGDLDDEIGFADVIGDLIDDKALAIAAGFLIFDADHAAQSVCLGLCDRPL